MEKEQILEQLRKVVDGRGGARKKKLDKLKALEELEPEKYKNEYEDDGSLRYKKLRANIAKQLKIEYGFDKLSEVPEEDINQAMENLRDVRQDEIEVELEKLKYTNEYLNKEKNFKKKAAYVENMKSVGPKTAIDVKKFGKPNYDEYAPIFGKLSQSEREDAKKMIKKISDEQKVAVLKLAGQGRKKKAPSAYNKFVGKLLKEGYSMKEAAARWNKK